MQGGLKVYAGAPGAARHYVEADRGRADDYYLAEGAGVARRFTASPDRFVAEVAPLSGDAYEAWVAGRDPESGLPRGRLRGDARAVRFVEVVVNGPKSWSLAAALHPDIAAAYDAAQDRAAAQILGWLAGHATTRVGPAGGQVQVQVEVLEAVTVAHHTSRAWDPHRHLHLQINARVFAAGKWRGLHTIGVRDSLAAINGIGHAAMACDPQFRAALAAHGYRMDGTGEILELADYVGPMSARNAQITRNVNRYEREWTQAHPGETLGPALRRSWDARAWAQDRPDKVTPQPGADLTERWRTQLDALGYRDPPAPVDLTPTPIGSVNRDAVAVRALTRLAAARSAWNPADVRGEVERLIATDGIVADPSVRTELTEDLTARALHRCVPLLERDGVPVAVPEHIRALTSPAVLEVEADLTTRLAARAATGLPDTDRTCPPTEQAPPVEAPALARGLDLGQAAAVAALVGDRALVVLEGAAGAGKTTTLAATRTLLERSGHRLVVATPTLKAAKVAAAEVGAAAGSAAALVFAYGWRWSADGAWTRLTIGQLDPVTGRVYVGPREGARLRPGDLLVVDEAGMLDQDTARALLTVADERQARVALLGDRHQLAAVGRGGVLDLAAQAVDPGEHLTLAGVHRFVRTDPAGRRRPDTEYADLTLAIRTGTDPGAVFDALLARRQIRLHPDAAALQDALAAAAAARYGTGEQVAVVVDTREQAADLNAAIRDQLVRAGRVDDTWVATTAAGQRIGAGDRIATRRNNPDLGVANRDSWTVTAVGPGGELLITPADRAPGPVTPARGPVTPASGAVTPAGAGQRVLPADYVAEHVELAYATTAYGVQGDTVPTAHLVVGESTGAASAYVGMTRGRQANTAHLTAADVQEAREQWIAAFTRDRADLGPAHAAQQAAAEAARYAAIRPQAPTRPLEAVLAELRRAWTAEQDAQFRLSITEPVRDRLRQLVALDWNPGQSMDGLRARERHAWQDAEHADRQARATELIVRADADHIRQQLLDAWDGQRQDARQASAVVLHGPGRFGQRRAAVARAGEQLTDWAGAWRPYLPALPTQARAIAEHADRSDDRPALWRAFDAAAHRSAEQAHPAHAALQSAAATARTTYTQAARAREQGRREQDELVARFGRVADTPDPAATLADIDREITAARTDLAAAQARIAHLTDEPALRSQPPELLTRERDAWQASRDADHRRRPRAAPRPPDPGSRLPHPYPYNRAAGRSGPDPGLGR